MTDMTTATTDNDAYATETAPPETPLPPQLESWSPLEDRPGLDPPLPPSIRILRDVALSSLLLSTSSSTNGDSVVVALGARCFWHVQAAIRRLPGMIDT